MKTAGLYRSPYAGAVFSLSVQLKSPAAPRLLYPQLINCANRPQPGALLPGARSILSVRANPRINPTDGLAFAKAAIAEIRKIKAQNPGQRTAVLFDLDNTLFDTRARTLHALQAFDAAQGTSHFASLTVETVGWNGEETARALGLPEDVVLAAHAAWERDFWNGENFLKDHNIEAVQALAHEAAQAGAEIYYLTGRIDALKDASLAQIKQANLPFAREANLLTKPSVGVKTGPFKANALLELLAQGVFMGFFVTDNKREIQDIHEAECALPLIHYAHALQRPGVMQAGTPIIGA